MFWSSILMAVGILMELRFTLTSVSSIICLCCDVLCEPLED